MASGDQNLWSLGCATDANQVHLGALSLAVTLVGCLFFERQRRLGAAQVQGDGAARFGLFNHAGNYVTLMLLELLIEEVPLRFPESLQHDLFGGLGGNTAGVVGQWFCGRDFITKLSALFNELSVGYGDLFIRILNRFHHCFKRKNAHFPSVGIERNGYVLARGRVVFFEG